MKYLKYLFSLFTILTITCLSAIKLDNPSFNQELFNYNKGIDISHYQGDIEWSKIDTTIDFIICKATEGSKFIDYKFEHNWKNIKGVKGCYHFFRPQVPGDIQALHYLKTVNFKEGDILPIIDVEMTKHWTYSKHRKTYVNNLKKMVSTIHDKTGLTPIIYTTGLFWDTYISKHYQNKYDHILWVADYRKNDSPKIPKDFNDWVIWQHTNKGLTNGIIGFVDLNYSKNIDKLLIKNIKPMSIIPMNTNIPVGKK